jgi:hypothetical protein
VRLSPRILVAALAALAIAITGGTAALADPPPDHRYCPNDRDWLLVPAALSPSKDKNDDQLVCTKLDGDPDKDNNNPPGEEDDVLDNEFPFLDL